MPDTIASQFQEIKNTVCVTCRLTNLSNETLIQPLTLRGSEGGVVSICVPASISKNLAYISDKFTDAFALAIKKYTGENYDVIFVEEQAAAPSTSPTPKPAHGEQIALPLDAESYARLNPKYTFDTFVVGDNNSFAHSAAMAVAEAPGKNYNPLYLYGGPGLGKTHLMHSVGHYILEHNPGMKVLYVTSEEFTNEVIESIRSGKASEMTRLRDKYRTVDVLMVDDVQFIIGKESTQEEFFNTFNVLHTAGKAIILSSDKAPREMKTLDERFRSRFEWGLPVDIQPPNYETRVAILRKNSERTSVKLSDDIIKYIADNITSNIRVLEGAFNKVVAKVTLEKAPMTVETAQETLKDIINPDYGNVITLQDILRAVCVEYNVSPDDITSKKRTADIVEARQVIMYLCRKLTQTPLDAIGKALGGRDHTTVLYGVNKVEADLNGSEHEEEKIHVDNVRNKLLSYR